MNNPVFQGYTFEKMIVKEDASVMVIKNKTGLGEMKCYEVIPGIIFAYNELRMESCYQQVEGQEGYLSLNYCRQGCFEAVLKNGDIFYMSKGDLVIFDPGKATIVNSSLPIGYYEGISLMIEIEKAKQWLSENVSWSSNMIEGIKMLIEQKDMIKVIKNNKEIRHLTENFYLAACYQSESYRRILVMAYLEYLTFAVKESSLVEYYSPEVTQITKDIYHYLALHINERITINCVCNQFNISKTSLLKCFKSMYGETPASYFRRIKMQHAANLLLTCPEKNISEIAMAIGYENASKFSAAFYNVMQQCPLAYRRSQEHLKTADEEAEEDFGAKTSDFGVERKNA